MIAPYHLIKILKLEKYTVDIEWYFLLEQLSSSVPSVFTQP